MQSSTLDLSEIGLAVGKLLASAAAAMLQVSKGPYSPASSLWVWPRQREGWAETLWLGKPKVIFVQSLPWPLPRRAVNFSYFSREEAHFFFLVWKFRHAQTTTSLINLLAFCQHTGSSIQKGTEKNVWSWQWTATPPLTCSREEVWGGSKIQIFPPWKVRSLNKAVTLG